MLRNAQKLTREEEAKYIELYKAGDREAGGVLIQSQIAWIYELLRRHNLPPNVDFDDVISELCIVLLKAFHDFDPSRTALTTYVATIVIRRTRRIVKKLGGPLKCQNMGDQYSLVIEQPHGDEWIETLLDAIVLAELVPSAQAAVCMHLAGIREDAIYDHLVTNYPCSEKLNVKKLITSAVECIRQKARELGLELSSPESDQHVFFAV
jgi:hypothetical protein